MKEDDITFESRSALRVPSEPYHVVGANVSRLLCIVAGFFAALNLARANNYVTQSVLLARGWNAVYLEVDPPQTAPAVVFAGLPVDVVADYAMPTKTAQFVRNPDAGLLAAYGWSVWYAPQRVDAFLSDLHAIQGGRGYLIHATTNATLLLTGTVPPLKTRWAADAFNFVGFSVEEPGAPTFAQFFASVAALQPLQIYRLVNGAWNQVVNPAATKMRSGEAFWIYSKGATDYQGPLAVATDAAGGIFLTDGALGDIVFRNCTTHPISFTVEHIVDTTEPVPLSVPLQGVSDAEGIKTLYVHLEATGWTQSFPPIEAGQARRFPLMLRADQMALGTRTSLLKVTSDMGTVRLIPLTATRTTP